MNKNEFTLLLKNNEDPAMHADDLEKLCADHPYFSVAQNLLAKVYHDKQDPRYDEQLQKAALSAGNRSILFNFINGLPLDTVSDKEVTHKKLNVELRVNKVSRPDFAAETEKESEETPAALKPIEEITAGINEPGPEEKKMSPPEHLEIEASVEQPENAIKTAENESREEISSFEASVEKPQENIKPAEEEPKEEISSFEVSAEHPEESIVTPEEELPQEEISSFETGLEENKQPEPLMEEDRTNETSVDVAPDAEPERAELSSSREPEKEEPAPVKKPVPPLPEKGIIYKRAEEETHKEVPKQLVESSGKLVRFELKKTDFADVDEVSQITDLSLDDKILKDFDVSSFSDESTIEKTLAPPEIIHEEEHVEPEGPLMDRQLTESKFSDFETPVKKEEEIVISDNKKEEEAVSEPLSFEQDHNATLEHLLDQPEEIAAEEKSESQEEEQPVLSEKEFSEIKEEVSTLPEEVLTEAKSDQPALEFGDWLNKNNAEETSDKEEEESNLAETEDEESSPKREEDHAFLEQIRNILKERAEKQKAQELGSILGTPHSEPESEVKEVVPDKEENPEEVYEEISSFDIGSTDFKEKEPVEHNVFKTAEVESILPDFEKLNSGLPQEEEISSESAQDIDKALPVFEFPFEKIPEELHEVEQEKVLFKEDQDWLASLGEEVDVDALRAPMEIDGGDFEDTFYAVYPSPELPIIEDPGLKIKELPKISDPQADNIIERFIQENPTISRPKAEFFSPLNTARQSVEEDESLATETLADIYISQGLFKKAISIYEKLALIYPDKSAYFAALVKELKTKHNTD